MFWRNRNREEVPTEVRHALVDIFKGDEMDRLAHRGTLVELATGQPIALQDTLGREVLVIALGTAVVDRDGDEIATVGPGDIVGEISVLTGVPRSATVIASEPVTGYVVSRREFGLLLEECPTAAAALWPETIRRVSNLSDA